MNIKTWLYLFFVCSSVFCFAQSEDNENKFNNTLKEFSQSKKEVLRLDTLSTFEKISNPIYRNKVRYTELSKLPISIYAFSSVIVDSNIYIIGGDMTEERINQFVENPTKITTSMTIQQNKYSDKIFKYSITKDTIETVTTLPQPRAYHNSHYIAGKIITIGGKFIKKHGKKLQEYLHNTIEMYDIEKDTIYIDETNPHQASFFASTLADTSILVFGGSTKQLRFGERYYSKFIHEFDLKSGAWYEIGEMPIYKEATAVMAEDKIYFIGGYNGRRIETIESYDLTNHNWKKILDYSEHFSLMRPALAAVNDSIFMFECGKLILFNTTTGALSLFDIDLSIVNPEMQYYENKLYILGGAECGATFEKTGEFDERISTPLNSVYSIDIRLLRFTNPRLVLKSAFTMSVFDLD
ncbi:MAG: hypothetical protein LBU91_00470 [Bacteroidales bacterium]|jgi:hypothetical protein|nr:hypothetical protein [Bacteroidales bacterium]